MKALAQLLGSLLTVEEMKRELNSMLPAHHVCEFTATLERREQPFQSTADWLTRQGLVGPALFKHLEAVRPYNTDSIRAVQELLDRPLNLAALDAAVGTLGVDQVSRVLEAEKRNDSLKYAEPACYCSRAGAEEQIYRFADRQNTGTTPCFVVTGRAGRGKSNLLAHLAMTLPDRLCSTRPHRQAAQSAPQTRRACVLLLNCGSLDLGCDGGIARALQEAIHGLPLTGRVSGRGPSMDEVASLARQVALGQRRLYLFFDAINEVRGDRAFGNLIQQFHKLFEAIAGAPVWVVLSCRTEMWERHFCELSTSGRVYRAGRTAPERGASIELDRYPAREIAEIVRRHFEWFGLDGVLHDRALEECRDPIVLRYFCETHAGSGDRGAQIKHIGRVSTIRFAKVFDEFAASRRKAIGERLEKDGWFVRRDIDFVNASPDQINERVLWLTTGYLLEMTGMMARQRSSVIRLEEILGLATELGHPDAHLGYGGAPTEDPADLVHSDILSVFRLLLEGGSVLQDDGAGAYGFVLESYFEFTLGRYYANRRWRFLSPDALREDLAALVAEHEDNLVQGRFPNVAGALHFALLAVDERIPDRSLLPSLLQVMVAASARRLEWGQRALAVIRASSVASPEAWVFRVGEEAARRAMVTHFKGICQVLESLSLTQEFVLLWDLEETLVRLASVNLDGTLELLWRWGTSGKGVQRLFAFDAMARLCRAFPEQASRVIAMLEGYADAADGESSAGPRSNYWLARGLMTAAQEATRRSRVSDEESPACGELAMGDRLRLQRLVSTFASVNEEPDPVFWAIQAVAVASVPHLGVDRPLPELEPGGAWLPLDQSEWTWWNTCYGLLEWWAWDDESELGQRWQGWARRLLTMAAGHGSLHVRYAVEAVLRDRAARGQPLSEVPLPGRHRWSMRSYRGGVEPNVRVPEDRALTGVVYTPEYLEPSYHHHVECRERVEAIVRRLERVGAGHISWINPGPVDEELAREVHSPMAPSRLSGGVDGAQVRLMVTPDEHRDGTLWPSYFEDLKGLSERIDRGEGESERMEGPVEMRAGAWHTALVSAGGPVAAIDYVLHPSCTALAAWCINRPPGHLANNAICMLNNIGIGARHAQRAWPERSGRVLIIDCDAHHGAHTNRLFQHDPTVVYLSMHQDTGYSREQGALSNRGSGPGFGYTLNLPYPKQMGDDGYCLLVAEAVVPFIERFRPGLVLVSAGFDGHRDDFITAGGHLSEHAFIYLAAQLRERALAQGFRIVGALEGGYGLEAMANCYVNMMREIDAWDVRAADVGLSVSRPTTNPSALEPIRHMVKQARDWIDALPQAR